MVARFIEAPTAEDMYFNPNMSIPNNECNLSDKTVYKTFSERVTYNGSLLQGESEPKEIKQLNIESVKAELNENNLQLPTPVISDKSINKNQRLSSNHRNDFMTVEQRVAIRNYQRDQRRQALLERNSKKLEAKEFFAKERKRITAKAEKKKLNQIRAVKFSVMGNTAKLRRSHKRCKQQLCKLSPEQIQYITREQ